MDEKRSGAAGRKTLGKIFLVFAAAVALAAMIFAAYMGGQKKAIEKFYTSLVRSDDAGMNSCISSGYDLTPEILAELETAFRETDTENGIIHVRVDYAGRKMYGISEADYYFRLSFYNDDAQSYTMTAQKAHIVRNGLGWKMTDISIA